MSVCFKIKKIKYYKLWCFYKNTFFLYNKHYNLICFYDRCLSRFYWYFCIAIANLKDIKLEKEQALSTKAEKFSFTKWKKD